MSATKDYDDGETVDDAETTDTGPGQTTDAKSNDGFDWKSTIPAVAVLVLLGDAIDGEVGPASSYELGNLGWLHGLVSNPVSWVEEIIVGFIYDTFLYPLGESLWNAGVATVDALIILGFGSDRAIGVAGASSFGILDIPFVIIAPVVTIFTNLTSWTVGGINSLNNSVASFISGFGIAAPIIVNVMVIGEVAALVWLVWTTINLVDVPLIRVVDVVMAAMRPIRRLWRWLL